MPVMVPSLTVTRNQSVGHFKNILRQLVLRLELNTTTLKFMILGGGGLLDGGSYSFTLNGEVFEDSNTPYASSTTVTFSNISACCIDPDLKFKMKKKPGKKYKSCG